MGDSPRDSEGELTLGSHPWDGRCGKIAPTFDKLEIHLLEVHTGPFFGVEYRIPLKQDGKYTWTPRLQSAKIRISSDLLTCPILLNIFGVLGSPGHSWVPLVFPKGFLGFQPTANIIEASQAWVHTSGSSEPDSFVHETSLVSDISVSFILIPNHR